MFLQAVRNLDFKEEVVVDAAAGNGEEVVVDVAAERGEECGALLVIRVQVSSLVVK